MVPNLVSEDPLQLSLQVVPCPSLGKESLRHPEGQFVVVRVEEPCRHVLSGNVVDIHLDRIEDVQSPEMHLIPFFAFSWFPLKSCQQDIRRARYAEDFACPSRLKQTPPVLSHKDIEACIDVGDRYA